LIGRQNLRAELLFRFRSTTIVHARLLDLDLTDAGGDVTLRQAAVANDLSMTCGILHVHVLRLGPQTASERRTCRVLGQPRSTPRSQVRRPPDEAELRRQMRALARQRPRFGAERIHRLLIERHWQVNEK
jgi:hypothetical protein